jgi:tetratricopeptide (TPR) repeat protein
VLTSLLLDGNLYARGQAIEIFLSTTDCDAFDWFQPLSADLSQVSLYREMYSLLETPLLQNLLANRLDSFPGGSMRCLQLIAFWLSWLRVHFTGGKHKLQLHLQILETLKVWETSADIEVEESQLARTLFEDFSAAGACNFRYYDQEKSGQLMSGLVASQFDSPNGLVLDRDLIGPPHQGGEEVRGNVGDLPFQLKEKGNYFFFEKKYLQALECYLTALDELSSHSTDNGSTVLPAILHYNCASSYWKLSEQFPLSNGWETGNVILLETLRSVDSLMEACIAACERCLNQDPNYFKARYRCAMALQQRGQLNEAVKILDPDLLGAGSISDPKMLERLQDLRRACVAGILVQQKSSASDLIDERTSRILAQISSRRCHQQPSDPSDSLHPESLPSVPEKEKSAPHRSAPSKGRKGGLKYLKKFRGCISSMRETEPLSTLETCTSTISLLKVWKLTFLPHPHQVLNQIWKEELTLGEVFGAALDEEIFVSVLLLLHCLRQKQLSEDADKVSTIAGPPPTHSLSA